jgi:DNA-binding transcriptional regulator GbsR (MarR family)
MATSQLTENLPSEDLMTRRILKVCDAVGDFIEYWGFKHVHGRIWALLALRTDPISQAEIGRTLGVSRSLVSETVSELVGYGLVRPTSERRNAPYEAVFDVWPTIADVLRSREWILLERAKSALEAAVLEAELRLARGMDLPWDLDRMRMLLKMTELFQSLLKFLIAMRMPQSFKGLPSALARTRGLVQSLRGAR